MESDESLLARFRQGDAEAVALFYRRYARPVYLFACSLTRDAFRAEDVVQQSFVRLLQRDPAAIGSVRGLLFTIARNLVRDDVRRGAASPALYPRLEGGGEGAAEDAERLDALSRALNDLPPEQRETVILKIHGELTFAEIAESLDIPEATAKSRYRYALERMSAFLKDAGVAP